MGFVALNRAGTYLSNQLGDWSPSEPVTVAIHGFGMIGKAFFIALQLIPEIRKKILVKIINEKNDSWNDHVNIINSPSIYGETGINAELVTPVSNNASKMILGNSIEIDLFSEQNERKLPLKDIDFLIDTSGDRANKDRNYFESFLHAGASKVILPNFNAEMDENIILGFNEDAFAPLQHKIIGCGSCSLNLQVLLLGLLASKFQLKSIVLDVLHATNVDQSVTDVPHAQSNGLLGRATGNNFMVVPSGSLGSIAYFLPELKDNIHALNIRVPVNVGMAIHSIISIEEATSASEVNDLIVKASQTTHTGLIRTVTKKNAFSSSSTQANPESAIVDISHTKVLNGNQVNLLAWQDPFIGYAVRILETILWMAFKER